MKSLRLYELAPNNSTTPHCWIFRRRWTHRGFPLDVLCRSQPKTTKSWLISTSFGWSGWEHSPTASSGEHGTWKP